VKARAKVYYVFAIAVISISSVSAYIYFDASQQKFFAFKVDFHIHTYGSDGIYSPSEVVNIYRNAGYDIIAITDHNIISYYDEAKTAGDAVGMTVIKGEEITEEFVDGTMLHIIALFITEKIDIAFPLKEIILTINSSVTFPDDTWDRREALERLNEIKQQYETEINFYMVKAEFDKIHELGGIGIVAHPNTSWENWKDYVDCSFIDAWEYARVKNSSDEVLCSEINDILKNKIQILSHDFHGKYSYELPHMDYLTEAYTFLYSRSTAELDIKDAILSDRIMTHP